MQLRRKPEDVYEQFLRDIETARDDELVALLTEPCDMTDYYDDINGSLSITATLPKQAGDEFGTWLAGTVEIATGDRPIKLLTRLALGGHEKAFGLVHAALKGWSPSPSLDGSYIQLPTAEVFLVEWEHYSGAEEPTQWRRSVESGEAAGGEVAAWPCNDEGYIEPFAGSVMFPEVVYDLSAATFESLRSSAKAIEAGFELEVAREHLHLHGEARENGDSLMSALGIDRCSAEAFGNRKKDPSLVTLVFNGELD